MASEAAVRVLFSLGCPASLLAGLWLRGARAAVPALNAGSIHGVAAEGCDYPGVTRQDSHAKRLIQLPSESGLPLSVTPKNVISTHCLFVCLVGWVKQPVFLANQNTR